MTTYFVTGGKGFIGYHLCKELLADTGNEVIAYDAERYFATGDDHLWEAYLQYRTKRLARAGVNCITGDVTNEQRLSAALARYEPDVVVHLAALPIGTVANEKPGDAHHNIYDTTITLLEAIRTADFTPDRFIYISSSMVYGDFDIDDAGEPIPASEDDHCTPKGVYGCLKLNGERITRMYTRKYDIPHTIVRPSAVYGPTDCNRRVTEIFLTNSLKGRRLRLDNGGEQELDFTYVSDLVKGIAIAADHENAVNETFNLTRGEGVELRELAAVIDENVTEVETYVVERERTRPRRGALDISKAKEALGYDPQYSLEEGMDCYVEFIESEGFMDLIQQKPQVDAKEM